MKRKALVFTAAFVALFALAAFTVARAQQTGSATPTTCPCMQTGMMGQGQILRSGPGNMGPMAMAGGMRMQGGQMRMRAQMMEESPMKIPGATIQVKSIDNGAQIRITSSDSKTARRIQILAQMMELRQELRNLQ
jgi:hypothetical protein